MMAHLMWYSIAASVLLPPKVLSNVALRVCMYVCMYTPTPNSPLLNVICTTFTRIVYKTYDHRRHLLTIADNFLFDPESGSFVLGKAVSPDIRHVFFLPLLSRPDQQPPSRRMEIARVCLYASYVCREVTNPVSRISAVSFFRALCRSQ